MAFDFKKEYKEFYMPKNKPGIVTVPSMNYIAVRGQGDPNTANVKHFFTLLGKMFFTLYGKEFFTYPGKQIFTS